MELVSYNPYENRVCSAPKFNVGDQIVRENGCGILIDKTVTITGIDLSGGIYGDGEPRYFIFPTDTPWFPIKESRCFKSTAGVGNFINLPVNKLQPLTPATS